MEMKEHTLSMPDWSLLPEELLHIISENVKDCFDLIHARSVCTSWRSTFPFPTCLLRTSYSQPAFKKEGSWTLEKIPLFLFRVRDPPVTAAASAPEYFLGGICQDESGDHMELPSPIQCSVKVKIPDSSPTLINISDCQIIPLGHMYKIIWHQEACRTSYRGVAVLPGRRGREEELVVLFHYNNNLLMTWKMWLTVSSPTPCKDLVSFRGRFYATFHTGYIFSFDPYAQEATLLMPSPPLRSSKYLVLSGDDELFLVERFNPFPDSNVIDSNRFTCRVSRLDEEAGKWVVVTELGDRVLFLKHFESVCFSAKKLPDGCGVSGNSIMFIDDPGNVTYAYKYGVHTGREEDDLNCWRFSGENRVTILSTSSVVALQVER